jgi:hypothetical protein
LRLLEHSNIFILFMRKTPQKAFHIECIQLPAILLLFIRPPHVFSICIEQVRKTAHESSSYTVGIEGSRADKRHQTQAAPMGDTAAARTLVQSVAIRSFIANRTDEAISVGLPSQTVALYPYGGFCIPNRLHQHIWHDCRGGKGRCCICRWRISVDRFGINGDSRRG